MRTVDVEKWQGLVKSLGGVPPVLDTVIIGVAHHERLPTLQKTCEREVHPGFRLVASEHYAARDLMRVWGWIDVGEGLSHRLSDRFVDNVTRQNVPLWILGLEV